MSGLNYRPWGSYQVLYDGPECKVKRIVVNFEQRLSLQFHHKRAEDWIIVAGKADVILGDTLYRNMENGDKIHIPREAKHRITNVGDVDLVFIEVQTGSYFGEDDIVRISDDYGRIADE